MASKSTINITFKLDGDSKGFQDLAKDANGLKTVMASAVVEAEKFKASIINWNQSIQAMSAVSNAVGSLNSALQNVTSESNSFSKAMRAANTMAGKDAEGFANLKGQVADLAKQIPVARDELANGLYQVISNGVPEDNWIEFLEKSARSSVGGIADLGQAVTVTSTIIKNYGLSWEEAGNIQDKIQLTAKNGVTSFEQLADALPSVAGSAAQLGVSIDELMAVFATCTGVTGNTSEVSTQLAAVLKSLIKPSSEAAKAAEKMGISFNAAAVREAGGLDAFLKNIDAAIQQYSAKTGELSETIYGQLFGSARALRLLTSLTGEQAEKFTENIGLMVDSAGTMDAAYENMANTVSAKTQVFQNMIATMTDTVAAFVAPAQPLLNLATQMGQVTLSAAIMIRSFTQMRKGITPLLSTLKNIILSFGALTTAEGRATMGTTGFGTAAAGATLSTKLFANALRGLMVMSGIGLVAVALSVAVDALTGKFKKASDAVEELSDDEKAFQDASVRAQGEINTEVKKLDALMKAHADTSEEVEHLNQKYGEIFGTYDTAAQWKDVLINKSKEYVKQLGYEAQAIELGRKAAEADLNLEKALADLDKIQNSPGGGMVSMSNTVTTASGFTNTTQWKTEGEALKNAKKAVENAEEESKKWNTALEANAKLSAENGKNLEKVKTTTSEIGDAVETKVNTPTTKVVASTTQLKTRLQEVNARLQEITDAYPTMSEEEQKAAQTEYDSLKRESDGIKELQAQLSMPIEFNNASDYERGIQSLNEQLKYATGESREALQSLLDKTQEAYDLFLGKGGETEEIHIVPPSEVKNIQECDDAIDMLMESQKTASATAYAANQRLIKSYQDQRDAITRLADIESEQNEVNGLLALSGKQLRVEVGFDGYEDFVNKWKKCQNELKTNQSLTDEERRRLEDLADSYATLAARAALSFNTLKNGWSSIEGIGNGIKGITDALKEDTDAWTMITSIIDNFIQIYEGISKVIDIIEALTLASGAHAVAKEVEGEASMTAAAEEVAGAAAVSAANAAEASTAETAAVANVEDAAAETFKAHSSIPFVGIAIAAGLVATMLAVMGALAFAEGGIAYGPTLGLFGEYAGASTNPEVVAPLDKLRSMLKTDEGMGGRVRFTIEGRTLVGILERENRVMSRR